MLQISKVSGKQEYNGKLLKVTGISDAVIKRFGGKEQLDSERDLNFSVGGGDQGWEQIEKKKDVCEAIWN